jgi:hypothetical protein
MSARALVLTTLLCAALAACSHRPLPLQAQAANNKHGETLRQGLEAQVLPRGQSDGLRPTARELRGIGGEVRGLGNETSGAQEALAPPISNQGGGSSGASGSGSGGGR